MKTPLQELIERLQEKKNMFSADGKKSDRDIRGSYVAAIMVAKSLLPKEKEVIQSSFFNGFQKGYISASTMAMPIPQVEDETEKYFNQTFNTDL